MGLVNTELLLPNCSPSREILAQLLTSWNLFPSLKAPGNIPQKATSKLMQSLFFDHRSQDWEPPPSQLQKQEARGTFENVIVADARTRSRRESSEPAPSRHLFQMQPQESTGTICICRHHPGVALKKALSKERQRSQAFREMMPMAEVYGLQMRPCHLLLLPREITACGYTWAALS